MIRPTPDLGGNPFPGLRPFREDEEGLFFGREAQVDSLVDRLAASHFLAVVGTSGSGKSSLVNCGLIPALHRGMLAAAVGGWRVAVMRPGNQPLRAMAAALARALPEPAADDSGLHPDELIEGTLRASKLGLLEAWREAVPADDGRRNLLLVVDQFEELFRYRALARRGAADEAQAFINLLLEVLATPQWPVFVVLTMRSDFLGDCAQFFGLPEAINRGQVLVPRMTRDERRAAIAGPLRVAGAEIDPALLTRLVNDVGDNPDQLSILQHALNRTWAHWRAAGGSGPLVMAHYEAVGTMALALDSHAEEALAELSTPRLQAVAEAMFRAITDKTTDARGTRRPTRFDSLMAITGASADELLAAMAPFRDRQRAFMLPPEGAALAADTPIDISHESLMRVWRRLDRWADEEARSARIWRRLADTAQLHAEQQAALLRPPDLQVTLQWRERFRPSAEWAVRYHRGFDVAMAFLDASAAAHERSEQEQAAQREAFERQRQHAQRLRASLRWGALGLTLLTLTLILIGTLWLQLQTKAQESEDRNVELETALSQAQLAERKASEALQASKRAAEAQARESALLGDIRSAAPPEVKARIDAAIAKRAIVYLHHAEPGQAAAVQRLGARLERMDFGVPKIEQVGTAPARNELRYFRREDEDAARKLAAELSAGEFGPVQAKWVAGFEERSQLRQLELWLARAAISDVGSLVQQLNDEQKDKRLSAGQALQTQHLANPAAIAAALEWFDPGQIGKLSAEGRINVLYYLVRTRNEAWSVSLVEQGRRAITTIEARSRSGVHIGTQTRQELDNLKKKIDTIAAGRS